MEVTFNVDLAGLLSEFKPKKKKKKGLGKVTFTKPSVGSAEEWTETGIEFTCDPTESTERCWWDHHPLPSQSEPVVIPGLPDPMFCSYECAMAFVTSAPRDDSKSKKLLEGLRHSFKLDHPTEKFHKLVPAPSVEGMEMVKAKPSERLIAYGGRMTIEKYRSGHHPKNP